MILAVTLAGCVLIALCGFVGRRRPSATLAEWTVGGRSFGAYTMWFLQAGEVFTTFTFLAVAGFAFAGGVAATYAIPYLPIAFIACYFLTPRVWELGHRHGYLTQADFFADRYRSRGFGRFTAIIAVVFLLPYLQIQITGLGAVVLLLTGSEQGRTWAMILAGVLTVAFVLWSGIRGIANTAYLKDVLMLVAMLVLVIAVPAHFAGGIGPMFADLAAHRPELLTVPSHTETGTFTKLWWVTGVMISAVAVGSLATAHQWPAYLSAKGKKPLRQNFTWLPIYQVVIILPVIIGFAGLYLEPRPDDSNGVLLLLAHDALPGWLTGVIAVAAASSAMVPAGVLCLSMSSLIAHNVAGLRSERAKLWLNHSVVVVATAASLYLALARPDLLGNLLLLTFAGLAQLAPAILAAIGRRRHLGLPAACSGLVVGVLVLWQITATAPNLDGVHPGVIALGANLAVAAVVELALRAAGRSGTVVLDEDDADPHTTTSRSNA
ncbi:sodium:solute symporter family protein [Pimelobacter simplex]|uniref:Na+/solute symporter n=1 Tax=Nocardioides simplex TaxID=2045 RepID=A0A0C5WYW0_NOCSI|nr:sodium:solute symporter family protein [Pimelobacter simplex]AJR18508.1 Na+/solute symporter [Pimelobacter simplex]MCG8152647.1 sodium:solute symporter family protein [Pimelobacter simplex]GEB16976.1 putative symporter YhjB [Pimelobacter simplex]SFM75554.1 solute:Na+ symporter, SSS family [Pimelobacter simplex]